MQALNKRQDIYKDFEKIAVKKIQALHESTPKYEYQSSSTQDELQEDYGLEVVPMKAVFAHGGEILLDGQFYSPEDFVALQYKIKDFDTLPLESRPFHVLFGIFFWTVIEDANDPKKRYVSFGERTAFENGEEPALISMLLPEDFGTEGYYERKRQNIEAHLNSILWTSNYLLEVFDKWIVPSFNLRNYLWGHDPYDVERARSLIEILEPTSIRSILEYLIGDYWKRYLGWPDLLIYNQDTYYFVEVKGKRDKLSDDQKQWVIDNSEILKLPFKVVKIHKNPK